MKINGSFEVGPKGTKNLLIIFSINLKLNPAAIFEARLIFGEDTNKRAKFIIAGHDYAHYTGYLYKAFNANTYKFDIQFKCENCNDTPFNPKINDNVASITVVQLD
jgi:hypothetical protein